MYILYASFLMNKILPVYFFGISNIFMLKFLYIIMLSFLVVNSFLSGGH